MAIDPGSLAALVVATSFAAGLNVYATVLTLGLLARFHWVAIPPGLDGLTHLWILIAAGILFALEFVADKIPVVDLIWNSLHTLVRIPVAALLAYHATQQLSPGLQIAATTLGAMIALATHGSKTAVRAAVTPSPEPISNIALSSAEDVAAIGLTWFATHHPWIAASLVIAILLIAAFSLRHLWRGLIRARNRLYTSWGWQTQAGA